MTTQTWSAWIYTDPQGRCHGDAVEVLNGVSRGEAEAKVAEHAEHGRGGFVQESEVNWLAFGREHASDG